MREREAGRPAPRRAAAPAGLVAALLAVVLSGCATVNANSKLGSASGNPSVAPPPLGSVGPSASATRLGGGGGTRTTHPAASPSQSPSYRRLGGDFAITMPTGLCYEVRLDDAGNYLLAVGADYLITYQGLHHPATVPFQLTNTAQLGMSSGDKVIGQQFAAYFGTYVANASNPYLGKTFKITATIVPPGTDNAVLSDDSVSATVTVPLTLPTDTNAHEIDCSPA